MMKVFAQKKILLGVSGGIAAYKACLLLRELQKAGAEVRVCMTPASAQFVGLETWKALSKQAVFNDVFSEHAQFQHIDYAQWADLYIVAPCTANTLAKITAGLGDDPVSLSSLASPAPQLIVPAMNTHMYASAAVQANLKTLKERGFGIVEPEEGLMACGDTGAGRFPELEEILLAASELLLKEKSDLSLSGKKILITAGRTEEDIDPVRYISNKSSGKTALALAEAAYSAGAEVYFIHGPMDISPPKWANNFFTRDSRSMHQKVLELAKSMDAFIMNAAVADFRPSHSYAEKVKDSRSLLQIELTENPNILRDVSAAKTAKQISVAFALETHNPEEHARQKLSKSMADMIVLNTPVQKDSGFGKDQVLCSFAKKGAEIPTPEMTEKKDLAQKLINEVATLLKGSE
jgi:phosphopantothenoylcysteine decarboxylase/phosphopantothenate--cysteine ligase